MDSLELIRHMCMQSGKSLRAASVEMGKSATFLSSTLARGGSVGVDILASLADVCGYSLEVSGHGEILKVEPRHE